MKDNTKFRRANSALRSQWNTISSVTSGNNKKPPLDDEKRKESSSKDNPDCEDDLRISKFLRVSTDSCCANERTSNVNNHVANIDGIVELSPILENEESSHDEANIDGYI